MSNVNQRIADLSPEKRALLERRLRNKSLSGVRDRMIPRRDTASPCPLSFAQQRLWFLEQLDPNSPLYNIPKAVRIQGVLNMDALQQALDAIAARHEVLRTTFATIEGVPMQAIGNVQPVALSIGDLGQGPEAEREAELQRQLTREAQRPFDLCRDLMLRATLFRLGAAEHVLLLTTHHIASDGWSAAVLIRELGAFYAAFATAEPVALSELPMQYADYAVWQRQWLQGEILEGQLAYWRAQLAGASPVLALPTDRPRPTMQTYHGTCQSWQLPPPLTAQLKALSRQEGVTLFMTLLAAWQTLLHRYSGQDDISVGSPIAGRTRVDTEPLIGFFVNTLVLRTHLGGNPTFRELLHRVREVAMGAYAHQDLPFEKLVEELQPERTLSHAPLFQVMFAFQNMPRQSLELPGLKVSPLEVDSGTAKFDLTLFLWEEAGGLRGTLEYNTDLFDEATISRMRGHFQTLLEGIVADPAQRLSDLPLLTEAERQQLLVEWNATQVEYPREGCLHQLFEAQVERTPNAIAAVCGGARLTYRELNQRANQLAHYLRTRGVGPEVLVGICVERSLELMVGLMGILKAGGAYVPLDPTYPKERLAFMLADSQVSVLLSQQQLLASLPDHDAHVICLDSDWEPIATQSLANLDSGAGPDNLAYVIYTSGSTGTPKGTLITHHGLVNYLYWCLAAYPVEAGCGSPVHSPLAFDATITALFSPLLVGRTVYLLPETSDLEAISAALRQTHDLSLIKITPAHLTLLSQQLSPADVATLTRALVIGGENLTAEQIAFWRQHAPATRIFNEYGPTETVVGCVVYEVAADWSGAGSVPIGRPIPNMRVYVLDRHRQPVPIGVPGELYLGGAGVARGYVRRPDTTAEKFLRDPFSDEPGARLYRTGDLVRYLPDGNLEFLGRLDDQVKIRGYRIELGEIEAVLSQHLAVQETVVIVREDAPGDKRLVAYLVPNREHEPSIPELRHFLRTKLPEYMVPAAFVTLNALPLTPNGKVDRRALPAPDHLRPEQAVAFVPPYTPLEEVVAGLWCELLGIEQVGINDNFFHLGGHSLLAAQLMSRLRDTFQVELPLRRLFETPTVARLVAAMLHDAGEQARLEKRATLLLQLAQLSEDEAEALLVAKTSLRQRGGSRMSRSEGILKLSATKRALLEALLQEEGVDASPVQRIGRRPEAAAIPLSFAQQRLWFLDQLEPDSALYNIPMAIRLTGRLNTTALEQSLNTIIQRHEALRTTFAASEGEPVQVITPTLKLALPLVDLRHLPGAEREAEAQRLSIAEAQRPFDLARRAPHAAHVATAGRERARAALDTCIISSRMAGPWRCSCGNSLPYTRPSLRGGLHRLRTCPFSTRIMRSGSDSGCRERYWSNN